MIRRKVMLKKMVTGIVVVIISALGFAVYLLIASRVGAMIRVSQENNINREIQYIKSELTTYIDVVEIVLNDTAATPIVTQAVMQPNYSLGNLKDFMDELLILNKRFNFTLLNYTGITIYSNDIGVYKDYGDEVWVSQIIANDLSGYQSATQIGDNHYWTVAVPVKYNNAVEGILVAEIPVSEFYNYTKISNRLKGIQIEILSDDQLLLQIGQVTDGWIIRDALPDLGVELKFLVDQSETEELFNVLKTNLWVIMLCFILMAAIILLTVTQGFIIKPIRELRRIIGKFMSEGVVEDVKLDVVVVEINELIHQYSEMSKMIIQREEALKVSEQTLINKNDRLENLLLQLESTQSMIIQQEKLASIGRLAAGVAHELNSPIGFVNGNFEILKEYLPKLITYIDHLRSAENNDEIDTEEIDYILEDIPMLLTESEEGFVRIIDIVKNLKEFSRIDIVKDETYDLNKGVKTTLMVARNEYRDIARIDEELGDIQEITANGSKINEVLLNLIVNASQALSEDESNKEKVIKIKTYSDEEYVYCKVSDNGPGISNDIIKKIFDPFFTTKEPGKGTGLGLNIAYNIIKNEHNGELIVESDVNAGTVFTMKLPKQVKGL